MHGAGVQCMRYAVHKEFVCSHVHCMYQSTGMYIHVRKCMRVYVCVYGDVSIADDVSCVEYGCR